MRGGRRRAPAAPVIESPADGGLVDDATPAVSGTAEPGSTVVVRDSTGAEVCSDVADATTGAWSCSPAQPLPDGEHTVTATATDGAGNTSPADTVTFTVDTSTSVNVLLPADGSTTQDLTPLVRGNGEPGASVTVTLGGVPVCTATVDPEGGWLHAALPLPLGTHTLTVTAEDEAGNTATDTTTFTIVPGTGDSTAPAAPAISSPAQGATVQDTTPLITGTGESGATVAVIQGSTVLCTAVVAGDGTWSCSSTVTLPPGQHTVSATQTDPAGNTSPADPVTFTVVAGPGDADGDGLPDQQEGPNGTDPAVPDTDGDGLSDGQEVNTTGTDPLVADTDDDGLTDGAEVLTHLTDPAQGRHRRRRPEGRARGEGRADQGALRGLRPQGPQGHHGTTDPLRKDTDRDGLSDGKEVRGYVIKQRVRTKKSSFVIGRTRSNPTKKDTDRDGLKDKVEMTGKANKRFGKDRTDPTKCDTDRGGVRDGAEVRARSNPADWRSGPRDPRVREGRAPADTFGIG